MSELKAIEYKRFENIKHIRDDGSEFWSARELGPALDYVKWENFSKAIKRAMIACENSGHNVADEFPEVRKIVEAFLLDFLVAINSSPIFRRPRTARSAVL